MARKKTEVIEDSAPKVHTAQMIADELLFEHPNNTNKQSKHVHTELVESIQQHGFDETLIVVPRTDGEAGYWIVAGNHRRRAGRTAGMLEFPCVVRADWNEVEARIQLVRRNLVRGDIDRVLFTEEVNRLSSEQGIALDMIMERMGFEDADAFAEFYKQEKKRERSIGSAVAGNHQANSQIKMLDDMGTILSVLFEKYGNTVPHSFIVFPLGGKNHIFIQMTPALKKSLDAITTKCVADGMDINTALGGLLQIAIHHTGFFKAQGNDKVTEAADVEGSTNPELLVKHED